MKPVLCISLGSLLVACGPSMEPSPVMTPEQRLQEQERLAYEAELAERQSGDGPVEDVDIDEREEFDKKQAELELKRASLSAVTCKDVVEGEKTTGIADISITFSNDGSVREATIAPPYAGTPLADCVLNAYKAVIVPPFRESEFTMPWQLDFDKKPPEPTEDEKADSKTKKKKK